MLDKLNKVKELPKIILIGQSIFLITIVLSVMSIAEGGSFLDNYVVYSMIAGCLVGVITTIIPQDKIWQFVIFDILVTAILFTSYVQVFAFT